jgi:hypothetical protein
MYPTEEGHACPECEGTVGYRFDCPRFMQNGRLMACMSCGNAIRFECAKTDEYGDLDDELGCGWWFQYPLHPMASGYMRMGVTPDWDYKAYNL